MARPFEVPALGEGRIVLARDGLTITAFVVDHSPVRPAVGYRYDFRGRSVLLSGDTKKNTNLSSDSPRAWICSSTRRSARSSWAC